MNLPRPKPLIIYSYRYPKDVIDHYYTLFDRAKGINMGWAMYTIEGHNYRPFLRSIFVILNEVDFTLDKLNNITKDREFIKWI